MTTGPENDARHQRRSVFLSSLGEVVEWFDFMIYLSLAPILAKVFFAPGDHSSFLATLGIFAAAFVARPVGAVLFGHLGDRTGRKRALVFSALLMAGAKIIEACLPSYATIGSGAAIIFLLARVLSGVSLGGEFTGTFVMLFESARPNRRGLTTSLANIMGGTGALLASGLVALLISRLSPAAMLDWGWRVPFFVGALIGLVALAIRVGVRETPLFEELQRGEKTSRSPLREAVRQYPRSILLAFALAGFNALTYYLVVAFVPAYLESFIKVDHATAMFIATITGAFNVLFIALPGWLSDRLGRRPLLLTGCIGFIVLSHPLYLLLASGNLPQMLAAALGFVVLATFFMGPANTALMEHFPTNVRYSGFALGYNAGAGLFGGLTPLFAAWMIHTTGNVTIPALLLVVTAAVVLVICWRMRETAPRA